MFTILFCLFLSPTLKALEPITYSVQITKDKEVLLPETKLILNLEERRPEEGDDLDTIIREGFQKKTVKLAGKDREVILQVIQKTLVKKTPTTELNVLLDRDLLANFKSKYPKALVDSSELNLPVTVESGNKKAEKILVQVKLIP